MPPKLLASKETTQKFKQAVESLKLMLNNTHEVSDSMRKLYMHCAKYIELFGELDEESSKIIIPIRCLLSADDNRETKEEQEDLTEENEKAKWHKILYSTKTPITIPIILCSQAVAYHNAGKYKEALILFKASAYGNNEQAQFNLAVMYEKCEGIDPSEKEKYKQKIEDLYKKAADKDHILAQVNLAINYYNKGDFRNSTIYIEKAAMNGSPQAQFNWALICYEGIQVGQDLKKALHFFELALKNGREEVRQHLPGLKKTIQAEKEINIELDKIKKLFKSERSKESIEKMKDSLVKCLERIATHPIKLNEEKTELLKQAEDLIQADDAKKLARNQKRKDKKNAAKNSEQKTDADREIKDNELDTALSQVLDSAKSAPNQNDFLEKIMGESLEALLGKLELAPLNEEAVYQQLLGIPNPKKSEKLPDIPKKISTQQNQTLQITLLRDDNFETMFRKLAPFAYKGNANLTKEFEEVKIAWKWQFKEAIKLLNIIIEQSKDTTLIPEQIIKLEELCDQSSSYIAVTKMRTPKAISETIKKAEYLILKFRNPLIKKKPIKMVQKPESSESEESEAEEKTPAVKIHIERKTEPEIEPKLPRNIKIDNSKPHEYRVWMSLILAKKGSEEFALKGVITSTQRNFEIKELHPKYQKLLKNLLQFLIFEKNNGDDSQLSQLLENWDKEFYKKLSQIDPTISATEQHRAIRKLIEEDEFLTEIRDFFKAKNKVAKNKNEIITKSAQDYFINGRFYEISGDKEKALKSYQKAQITIYKEQIQQKTKNPEDLFLANNLRISIYNNILALQDSPEKTTKYEKKMAKEITYLKHELGLAYYFGKGTQQNLEKALELFQEGAAKNYGRSQHNLGVHFSKIYNENLDKNNLKTAIKWFKLGAKKNLKESQHELGICYLQVSILEENSEKQIKAEKFLKLAAAQNYGRAQDILGSIYKEKEGIDNLKEAEKYYKSAQENGYETAKYNLEILYFENREIFQKSLKESWQYFLKLSNNPEFTTAEETLKKVKEEWKKEFNAAIKSLKVILSAEKFEISLFKELFIQCEEYENNVEIDNKEDFETFNLVKEIIEKESSAKILETINIEELPIDLPKIFTKEEFEETKTEYSTEPESFDEGDFEELKGFYEAEDFIETQFNSGLKYFKKNELNDAKKCFEFAANENHARAQYYLGATLLELDKDNPNKDFYTISKLFKSAADKGVMEAQYMYATMSDEKIKYLQLAAQQNYKPAQFLLARFYEVGNHVPRNISKAVNLYKLAAGIGSSDGLMEAQFNLAQLYFNGENVVQDFPEAARLFKLAAKQGSSASFNALGIMHETGKGAPQDYELAFKYYQTAAGKGYNEAFDKINSLKNTITQLQKIHTQTLRAHNNIDFEKEFLLNKYQKPFSLTHPAQNNYNLGDIYLEGIGVTPDLEKGLRLINGAVNENYPPAKYKLAMICFEEKNTEKGLKLLESSASQYAPAKFELAMFYLKKEINLVKNKKILSLENINIDVDKWVNLLKLSANQGYAPAQFELGVLYCKTQNQDYCHKGKELILLASQQGVKESKLLSNESKTLLPTPHISRASLAPISEENVRTH